MASPINTSQDEVNFGARVRELEQTLQTWQKRKLTLDAGKINIFKTLGLSKLTYNSSVLSVLDQYIKQINILRKVLSVLMESST